jgi:hypothetical protein
MFSGRSKAVLLVILSFSLLLAGSAYTAYLHLLFPKLVPSYGGGEGFTLGEANDFTLQMPWWAYSRLHLDLQANDTVELYVDGDFVCVCSHYELVVEGGDEALVLLRSGSPVEGWFTARQEIPLERQLTAFALLLAGLVGMAISIRIWKKGANLDI